ncbi:XTP/dITP diphosphatase [Desulfoprunum benzoelyticum]|uniref:dITP/XTP pyrophosphatase n=1 Tax=Desulfoprunum benzoelyticum TaxID=1506996 RepID=A0A840UVS9_9BACT|nr:XTP/dITP diphosphatase [Desulfoprunum benzoelyticum]MBB5347504.1 XTP/dITP diphosphohydrolase [Desulfoprunum benzoelyticum]MBM9529619.1 XTP/dITP diphosphatase [Desulfoprunum benzoelyticum]
MVNMIVLATNNKKKVEEFQEILKGYNIELKCVSDFGRLPEPVEDGDTFDENAYKKALHYAKVLGLPAIADDSGLVVEALNGEPGVYSARYAGENATDEENCYKLLEKMEGITNRKAAFQCVLSIAVPSGPALTYEGSCQGVITETMQGSGGFGYDPLFFYPEFGKTFAEMTAEEKNTISHRSKALAEFATEFAKVRIWIDQRLAEEKPPKPDHSQFEDNDWSS